MSRKLFVCLTLSLLTLLWANPAQAQGFRWWKDDSFSKELALTPDQMHADRGRLPGGAAGAARAEARAVEARRRAVEDDARGQGRRAGARALRRPRSKPPGPTSASSRTMMIFRMRRILTAEQHVKLQKLFEQNEKERRGKATARSSQSTFSPERAHEHATLDVWSPSRPLLAVVCLARRRRPRRLHRRQDDARPRSARPLPGRARRHQERRDPTAGEPAASPAPGVPCASSGSPRSSSSRWRRTSTSPSSG